MDNPLTSEALAIAKELRLLFHILAGGRETVNKLEEPDYAGIDWTKFLVLAKHHRVIGCLHKKLAERERARIPDTVLFVLKREHKKNVIRMLILSGEMERLCKLFAERGIRLLQLKGPALALDLFGDLSLRSSKDLDILVDPHDLPAAEDLLRELGYTVEGTVYKLLNGWRWRNYHKPFLHPRSGVNVEVHWRLGPGPSREPAFDDLWERRRSGNIAGFPVYYLGREDQFYYLVSHGARHGWFRLQWLRDIDRMARQKLNWKIIGLHLSQYQALPIGGQALLLAAWLLGTPLDDEMRRIAGGSRCRFLAVRALSYIREKTDLHGDLSPPMVRDYKQYLYEIKSVRQKFLHVLSGMYPHPLDAETLRLPNPVHFLYFPLRPVLWAWRKARKSAWT